MLRIIKTTILGLAVLALAACASVGVNPPRTDTVANACEDVGGFFKEGLELRLAGLAANRISEILVSNGLSKDLSDNLVLQVMAQTLPKAQAQVKPYLDKAKSVMAESCTRASAAEEAS